MELKVMYDSITRETESKVISGMKENVNVFFKYARARQKTYAKIGPFLDPESGKLNLDPDYSAECLSEQYSPNLVLSGQSLTCRISLKLILPIQLVPY